MPDDEIDLPQYDSSQATAAAGITAPTLKNWMSRKPPAVFLTKEERRLVGDRTRFRFPLRRILQIAITAELVRYGLGPRRAAEFATGYTDFVSAADSRKGFGNCRLYPQGYTLLVAIPDEVTGLLVNVGAGESWEEVLRDQNGWHVSSAIVVNLNRVEARVRRILRLPQPDVDVLATPNPRGGRD